MQPQFTRVEGADIVMKSSAPSLVFGEVSNALAVVERARPRVLVAPRPEPTLFHPPKLTDLWAILLGQPSCASPPKCRDRALLRERPTVYGVPT
jgi:hypothetical protein